MRRRTSSPFARAVAASSPRGTASARCSRSARGAAGRQRRRSRRSRRTSRAPRGKALVVAGAAPAAARARARRGDERGARHRRRDRHLHAPVLARRRSGADGSRALARRSRRAQVDTLVVTAWNPLYTAPADLDFARAFAKVKNSIVLALREDETVRAASWKLPRRTSSSPGATLRARDGTVSLVQPLIAPLHDSATEVELLAALVGERQGRRLCATAGAAVRRAGAAARGPPGSDAPTRADPATRGTAGSRRASADSAAAPPSGRRRDGARVARGAPRGAAARRRRARVRRPTTRSATAASPRTPGCRSCPTRSRSSPGTTPPTSRRRRRRGSALDDGRCRRARARAAAASSRRC